MQRPAAGRTRRCRAFALATATLAAAAFASAAEPSETVPAAGGAPLLRASEHAKLVAIGAVEHAGAVDLHGWAADFRVERVLAGEAPGPRVRIAWEELAQGRPARFREGERAIVALEPAPGQSLWRKRFPRGGILAIADRGRAFLRDPDANTIDALAAWVALAPAAREETPGVAALAAIVAGATPPLAEAALVRLGEIAGLAGKLDAVGAAALARALSDPGRSAALRAALARLAGQHELVALRSALESQANAGPPVAAAAWGAIAALDGGLPAARLRELLASPDPGVRALAATEAAGGPDVRRVERMATEDPAPEVRAAAVRALVAAQGRAAEAIALRGLLDSDVAVRQASAHAAAELGPEVVPALRQLAEGLTAPRAAAPMSALALVGPQGQAVLVELAESHPDERTRKLALLLLGRDPHQD